jgi:hypothetical protein
LKIRPILLLAATAAGVLAPVTAAAKEISSLNGAAAINDYMQQQDVDRFRAWEAKNQVTSVTQFSDVQPTTWLRSTAAWPATPTAPTKAARP